jgi:hypothetical protein
VLLAQAAVISALSWVSSTHRFSLRITTTLVAVVLGLAVWAAR